MKYKIGDKVKIIDGSNFYSEGIPDEEIVHGSIPNGDSLGEITYVNDDGYVVETEARGKLVRLGYYEDTLELVESKKHVTLTRDTVMDKFLESVTLLKDIKAKDEEEIEAIDKFLDSLLSEDEQKEKEEDKKKEEEDKKKREKEKEEAKAEKGDAEEALEEIAEKAGVSGAFKEFAEAMDRHGKSEPVEEGTHLKGKPKGNNDVEGKDGEVTKGAGKVIKKEKSGRLHALRST